MQTENKRLTITIRLVPLPSKPVKNFKIETCFYLVCSTKKKENNNNKTKNDQTSITNYLLTISTSYGFAGEGG